MSRVRLIRVREWLAWKKLLEFCSRRENGRQLLNVELERNDLKKSGQEGEVKLLPREVSNGRGRGVVEAAAMPSTVVEEGEEDGSEELAGGVMTLE